MPYICQMNLLKQQNWNIRRIKLFLRETDAYFPNPNGEMYRKKKMYDVDRVVKADFSEAFRADVLRYLSTKEREEANAGNL